MVDDSDFSRGAGLYAAGKYWDAHEAWEALWRATEDAEVRLLLQGLIQVAAALYKCFEKRDRDAAERIFARAISKLEELPSEVGGVNVASFREAATSCRDLLEHGQRAEGLDPSDVPALEFT